MVVSPTSIEETGILNPAASIISSAQSMLNTDKFKDIFEFIVNVLKQAGFDLKDDTRSNDHDIINQNVILHWFDPIGEKVAGPGDLVSYLDPAGQKEMGLIESYNADDKTGRMYAMDASKGEVSSLDLTEADIEGASFLRPKMDLFMGNLAGLFAGMDEDRDDDQYVGPSYPSPRPY